MPYYEPDVQTVQGGSSLSLSVGWIEFVVMESGPYTKLVTHYFVSEIAMAHSSSADKRPRQLGALIARLGSGRLLVIALIVTVAAVILLVLFYRLFQQITGAAANPTDWLLLEGFTSMLTLAVVIGGGLFALTEYIEAEDQRRKESAQAQFGLYDQLVARLMNPEEIEIRRWVIQNIPIYRDGDDFDAWVAQVRTIVFTKLPGEQGQAKGHRCVKAVLNTFDYLGFVAINYWDLDGPLMDWMNPMITKVWERIGPYIEEESRRRCEPDYYRWAREFGGRCMDWRTHKDLPDPVYVDYAL